MALPMWLFAAAGAVFLVGTSRSEAFAGLDPLTPWRIARVLFHAAGLAATWVGWFRGKPD